MALSQSALERLQTDEHELACCISSLETNLVTGPTIAPYESSDDALDAQEESVDYSLLKGNCVKNDRGFLEIKLAKSFSPGLFSRLADRYQEAGWTEAHVDYYITGGYILFLK